MVRNGEKSAKKVIAAIKEIIESEHLAKIDYVELVDSEKLQPVETIEGPILTALAVYIGKTRLIDNFFVDSLA